MKNPTHTLLVALVASVGFAVCGALYAQSPAASEYRAAEAAGAKGDARAMEREYDALLARFPEDGRALVGRATARSWQGKRTAARADFEAALAQNANDVAALNGLAYDYAWGGEYASAEQYFERVLALEPDSISARKGLAFTFLWGGNPDSAEQLFAAVLASVPADVEAHRGIGQARLARGRSRAAEQAFVAALTLDPTDSASRNGIEAARGLPPPFELALWTGESVVGNDFGVRSFELASWLSPKTRIALRNDDSLSLDNPALARAGVDADAWFVGALRQLSPRLQGSVEIGKRDLSSGVDQDIVKIEGALAVGKQTLKLGVQSSANSLGFDDTLLFGGLGFPVADRVRVETMLFTSESGSTRDDETRATVFAEYQSPRRWSVGGGVGVGHVSTGDATTSGRVLTSHVIGRLPLGASASVYAQVRTENGPVVDYSLTMLGVTVRAGRR